MLSPPFPRLPVTDIAIDFVGPLRSASHYDMLLTCTCRLSGYTRLIPVLQSDTAEKTATRLFNGWISIFGAPSTIISDRDKTWTSKLWKLLMDKLNISFHMTSAFHPQADGRSERTNKTGKWLESLPAVEFAINSAINVSTGFSPFELLFGRKPQLFPSSTGPADTPLALTNWLKVREGLWSNARDKLWASQVRQAVQHNKKHQDPPPLVPGSYVLLNSGDWRGRHQGGVDKLKERFEGPYRVIQVCNHGQSVELDLPYGNKHHSTLHVSKNLSLQNHAFCILVPRPRLVRDLFENLTISAKQRQRELDFQSKYPISPAAAERLRRIRAQPIPSTRLREDSYPVGTHRPEHGSIPQGREPIGDIPSPSVERFNSSTSLYRQTGMEPPSIHGSAIGPHPSSVHGPAFNPYPDRVEPTSNTGHESSSFRESYGEPSEGRRGGSVHPPSELAKTMLDNQWYLFERAR
ncbi:hypothetical protein MJO28_013063 [Puccinia striiformis f. sp. tritici]|uniref:Uncharacterized protein n=1 Tax=Puccinia striiformis f. sp. tritici TaxID=168172 RepID=A0ACC0DZ65_9BASI|nr:hypothetical protein MJO28_013063 [Puccinia striiformis f. sp. tritici]